MAILSYIMEGGIGNEAFLSFLRPVYADADSVPAVVDSGTDYWRKHSAARHTGGSAKHH